MALSNQALALISISALLLSTFAVEAHLAPSPAPAPTPSSYLSSSLKLSPSPSPSPAEPTELIPLDVEVQVVTDVLPLEAQMTTDVLPLDVTAKMTTDVVPVDVKAQMTKFVEGNMQMTVQKIDQFSQALKKRLNDPETTSATKECIQQCNEVYDAAKDDIEISLKSIKAGDLYKANFDISSITTNVETCAQCFEEMVGEEDPELKKLDDWVRRVTDDSLGALGKVAS